MNGRCDVGDWRLRNQKRYLARREFTWAGYRPHSEQWDHDHCAFCWRKFAAYGESLTSGYVTTDHYHWVCKDCFNDFQRKCSLKLVPGAESRPGP